MNNNNYNFKFELDNIPWVSINLYLFKNFGTISSVPIVKYFFTGFNDANLIIRTHIYVLKHPHVFYLCI